MEQIKLEFTRTYTKTYNTTVKPPDNLTSVELSEWIVKNIDEDDIDEAFTCIAPMEHSLRETVYYNNPAKKEGWYLNLKRG